MLKKYWREIALFVAVAVIFVLFQAWQNANDDKIAARLVAQAEENLRKQIQDINIKYAAENVNLLAERNAALANAAKESKESDEFKAKSEAAQKEIKNLKSCAEQLQATNTELDICQNFVLKQKDDYNNAIVNLNDVCNQRVLLCQKENGEKITVLTNEIGRITNIAARYSVRSKRRIAVGPSVGYGVQGLYLGFGITYRLFEFGI